jgi:hypothetical protein
MNTDMHTLFWYIRSELVLIRRRSIAAFTEKVRPKKKFSSEIDDDETVARNGVDEIFTGIIHTLDDILNAEAILWNLLFLVHIVQSLSVHNRNLTTYDEMANTKGYSLVCLDLDFTRVYCYLEILMDVCRANLVQLCTKDTMPSQKNEGSNSNGSLPIRIPYNGGVSNISPAIPTSPQQAKSPQALKNIGGNVDLHGCTGNVVRLKRSNSKQGISTSFISDKIENQTRFCSKLVSKDLLTANSHANDAMLNSMTDDGAGLPTYGTQRSQTREKVSLGKTPHSILRWRAAQHTIQLAVRIPRCVRTMNATPTPIETQ